MKKHILMVYPEIPITYWGFEYALEFIEKKASIPPLGLLTVAALLPGDYEVTLVDMNVSPLHREAVETSDMVFISAMIIQKRSFEEVVRLCKDCGKPVVAGGPYAISSHETIQDVDHFVLDEAELTLPVFLEDLEAGCAKKVYRDAGKPDLKTTPLPRFDLIDVNDYDCMPLQYSRGCPYNCEFCDIISMFGRKQRTKPPGQLIRELKVVYETGFRGALFLVDDNFVGNRRKVKELLREIVEWQREKAYPFSFLTEASIDLAQDDELLDLMVEAGFDMVFIGVETPDEETLLAVQKRQNLKIDLIESIEKIQHRGIEVTAGFILGFDTDRENIFDRQIEFVQKAAVPVAMVGLLTAVPDTDLYRRLEKENRILSDPTGNNTHDFHLNFKTIMPKDVLIEGYKRVLSEIYAPSTYFKRCLNLLKRIPARVEHPARPVNMTQIKILFRSLKKQTFSFYGWRYLSFLLKSLFINRRQFPKAVTLAVKGHHFFLITREILKADEFSTALHRIMESMRSRSSEAVAGKSGSMAHEVLSYVHKVKISLQKEYCRLSFGVQQYLKDAFDDFERLCERIVLELARLP